MLALSPLQISIVRPVKSAIYKAIDLLRHTCVLATSDQHVEKEESKVRTPFLHPQNYVLHQLYLCSWQNGRGSFVVGKKINFAATKPPLFL